MTVQIAKTLRDEFAIHCPDSWLKQAMPKTLGAVRDALIERGIIPASRAKGDVTRAYDDQDVLKLLVAIRYEFADAMMKAREAMQ